MGGRPLREDINVRGNTLGSLFPCDQKGDSPANTELKHQTNLALQYQLPCQSRGHATELGR